MSNAESPLDWVRVSEYVCDNDSTSNTNNDDSEGVVDYHKIDKGNNNYDNERDDTDRGDSSR